VTGKVLRRFPATSDGTKTPSNHNRACIDVRAGVGQATTGIQQAHVSVYVRMKNLMRDDAGFGEHGNTLIPVESSARFTEDD